MLGGLSREAAAIHQQQFGIAPDDGQHVVEIVRHPAGKLAHRLHLLRLAELGLKFLAAATVVVTNTVPVVTERTNVVYVTNAATGAVSGYMAREPVATNLVAAVVTNFVPVFYTNVVQVPVTNLVAKPEALATIEATGSVVNTFAPGIGSILALALAGLYHSRVDGRQAASLLGFQPHDIPVLVAAKLLQPLGKPVANAIELAAAGPATNQAITCLHNISHAIAMVRQARPEPLPSSGHRVKNGVRLLTE